MKKYDSYTIQKIGRDWNNKVADIYYNEEDGMYYTNMYENVPFDDPEMILISLKTDDYEIL